MWTQNTCTVHTHQPCSLKGLCISASLQISKTSHNKPETIVYPKQMSQLEKSTFLCIFLRHLWQPLKGGFLSNNISPRHLWHTALYDTTFTLQSCCVARIKKPRKYIPRTFPVCNHRLVSKQLIQNHSLLSTTIVKTFYIVVGHSVSLHWIQSLLNKPPTQVAKSFTLNGRYILTNSWKWCV